MKLVIKLCLSCFFFGLAITNCTSDYIALEGKDGIDGLDGKDANTAGCVNCHSSNHRESLINSYIMSAHGSGGSWSRGTRASCAKCHNNKGFIDYLSGNYYQIDYEGEPNEFLLDSAGEPILNDNDTPNDPSDDFYEPNPDFNPNYGEFILHPVTEELIPSANPEGYPQSEPIDCTGCHADHRSFDFENDGNDFAVRAIEPVQLALDPTISIDFSNSSSDELGLSNLCIHCHQPRASYQIPSGVDDITITSKRYGPHHGPQSTILEGVMGANIFGSTGYPGVGTSAHRMGASCTSCHMGESSDGTNGGHSFINTESSCSNCHTSGIPSKVAGFDTDLQLLKELLIANNLLDQEEYILGGDGENLASSDNPLIVPVRIAQAIWNYKTISEDNSEGIHNPNYLRALLKNSIEVMLD
jgi:hypothetical protein